MSLMSSMLREVVIDGILMTRIRRRAEEKAVGLGLYALAGLLAAGGLFFLVYAGFLALQDIYSPLGAALWAGGVLSALAVVLVFTASLFMKRRRRRHQAESEQIVTMVQTLIETLESEISEPVRENPKTALLLAGLAGLFVKNFIR